ncbi:hypothetical protein K474DRAFT_1656335 [Panus rudis PR-1116 ss-1]|nr:hypothetical protein K474DRAFT_1656335 [Panus rudis PR-1116 ss-1]
MARFAAFFIALASVLSVATASPVPSNETEVLETRAATRTGRGTWFNVGLGACGNTDHDSQPVVAISSSIYGNGGNCNQWLKITNKANGKTAYGRVRDACPGCGANDIDMSPSLFQKLGSLDTGVLNVQWEYQGKDFKAKF